MNERINEKKNIDSLVTNNNKYIIEKNTNESFFRLRPWLFVVVVESAIILINLQNSNNKKFNKLK